MWSLFSSCRRTRSRSPERGPLLPERSQSYGSTEIGKAPGLSGSPFVKFAEILGSLKASKYPSQEQVTRALRLLLSSDLLGNPDASDDQRLSVAGVQFISQLHEIIEAIIVVGLEKNGDNTLQQLLHEGSEMSFARAVAHTELHVEDDAGDRAGLGSASADLPSEQELSDDAAELVEAIAQLSWLLIASTAFRTLISDILLIVQELTAAVAVEVETIASQVDVGASKVEDLARSTGLSLDEAKQQLIETRDHMTMLSAQQTDRLTALELETSGKLSDTLITRIQQVVVSAQESPPERKAVRTILSLIRKYSNRLSASVISLPESAEKTAPPVVHPELHTDPRLAHFLSLCQTLLERFASGQSSEPLLRLLYQVTVDIINIPSGAESHLRTLCRDVGTWIDRALDQHSFATSRIGTAALERLLARGEVIFGTESHFQLAQDLRALVHEMQTFTQKISSDGSTRRLVDAVDGLLSRTAAFGRSVVASAAREPQRWKSAIQRDAIVWWLPRLLAAIKNVPLPRVEYKDSTIDVALDSLLLTSTSASAFLQPDHVRLQNWSELRIDTVVDGQQLPARAPQVQTVDRVHVHLDGMRFSAEGFGYFFRYKGWLGYQDQGLLSVRAGHGDAPGKGLRADVSLVIALPSSGLPPDPDPSLFRVEDIVIDIPGLRFTVTRSKHWILNSLLVQPFSGPIVRRILSRILQTQIRKAVDELGKASARIAALAEAEAIRKDEDVSIGHYWYALMQSDIGAPEASPGPPVVSTTALSLTGAARTTAVFPGTQGNRPPAPEETTLAVGIGPQVVPGDAGPYADSPGEGPTAVLQAAASGIAERIGRAGSQAVEAVEHVASAREEAAEAQRYGAAREHLERRKSGWRSDAFDL